MFSIWSLLRRRGKILVAQDSLSCRQSWVKGDHTERFYGWIKDNQAEEVPGKEASSSSMCRFKQLLIFVNLTLNRLALKEAIPLEVMSMESENIMNWLI